MSKTMKSPRKKFSKYNKYLAINLAVLFGLIISLTFILEQKKLLVAPQFVASSSFDEKARFFREVKPEKSQIVAVGSSVTVNHLDAALLKDEDGNQIPFTNFGFYGLPISELKYSLDLAVKAIGKPNTVLISAAPVDFHGCFASAQADGKHLSLKNLNQEDLVKYIWSDIPGVFYHAKYRDLWRMIDPKLMLEVRRQRNTNNTLDSLKFDSSGSVLLEVPKENISPERWQGKQWSQVMSQLSSPQNACYDSFQELVARIEHARMKLVFVLSPIRQGYLNEFDPNTENLVFHKKRLAAILSKSNSILIDAHSDLQLSDEYFADAIHLNKTGAQILTKYVIGKLNQNLSAITK
jgi:hypothetical protein